MEGIYVKRILIFEARTNIAVQSHLWAGDSFFPNVFMIIWLFYANVGYKDLQDVWIGWGLRMYSGECTKKRDEVNTTLEHNQNIVSLTFKRHYKFYESNFLIVEGKIFFQNR